MNLVHLHKRKSASLPRTLLTIAGVGMLAFILVKEIPQLRRYLRMASM